MKKLIVFAIVIMLMAAAAFVVTKMFLMPTPTDGEAVNRPEKADAEEHAAEGPGHVFMVDQLLVNPTGTSGTRFLSTSIGLEVTTQDALHVLEERQMQIRDQLITILSARTVEELTSMSAREQMRQEIIARLNKLISPGELTAVYFVDYVLQ